MHLPSGDLLRKSEISACSAQLIGIVAVAVALVQVSGKIPWDAVRAATRAQGDRTEDFDAIMSR